MDEKRLQQFEKMLAAVQKVLARKMTYQNMLSMYELYDLIEK